MTDAPKFTKVPWKSLPDWVNRTNLVFDAEGKAVCAIESPELAQFVSASPDLYEACSRMLGFMSTIGNLYPNAPLKNVMKAFDEHGLDKQLRDAISKAEGR